MRVSIAVRAALLLALPSASVAQQAAIETRWGRPGLGTMAAIERHHRMMSGLPAPYSSMHDRSDFDEAKLARGAALFKDNCSGCHGLNRQGSGSAARKLYPRPANLTWLAQMPKRQAEPYLYWTIAEGGQEFGSDMPAFKTKLSRNDIWAVISYVRTAPARDRRP